MGGGGRGSDKARTEANMYVEEGRNYREIERSAGGGKQSRLSRRVEVKSVGVRVYTVRKETDLVDLCESGGGGGGGRERERERERESEKERAREKINMNMCVSVRSRARIWMSVCACARACATRRG